MRKRAIAISLVVALGVTTSAAEESSSLPCDQNEAFRSFDFWLGMWAVHDAKGQLAGHNHITRQEDGCYLLESWRGASGTTGSSMNYYDAAAKRWVQHWVSPNGMQIQIEGGLDDGAMVLTGKIYYLANDQQADIRGRWRLLDDGRVRQFFEQSTDGGENWVPWFEGFYTRVTSIPPLSAPDKE